MPIEPHRRRVDGDARTEADAFGKITVVELMGHSARCRAAVPPVRGGAQEKTRTSTSFRPLEPESSASTNSATWASGEPEISPVPTAVNASHKAALTTTLIASSVRSRAYLRAVGRSLSGKVWGWISR